MKAIDLANFIYIELGEPSDLSVSNILYRLLNSAGQLNNYISSSYVAENEEYVPELSDESAAILTEIYLCYYFNRKANNSIGASAYEWVQSVKEGDTTITRLNRNEIAKTFRSLAQEHLANLKEMAKLYKHNQCLPASYNLSHICIPKINREAT